MSKKLINLSNLQKFLSKLNEKFALKKAMKGISEDAEGNIIIGEEGLVPAPNENSKGKFLRSDGEWALPSETAVYDSMTIKEGVAGVSKVDRVINAKNLKQIVNSDGFLTSLDSSKLTGVINIENLPQGALERILIVSSKEERLTLLDTDVQLGDVVKESDTGLMYYVINTEKLNSEEGYTQFTAGSASSVPWSGVTDKPTIPTKTSDLTNDSDFAIDNNVVHTSGNETIAGVKTFTASPFVSNYAVTNGYFTKLNDVARNEVPSQIYHSAFRVFDKNDKTLGECCVEKSTSGSSLLHMDVHTEDSEGNDIMESLYLNLSNDGSTVSFHPTKNNRTDLGMAHYKWAKIYSDDVVHTSGNETINGIKTFTSGPWVTNNGTTNGYSIKLNTVARNEVPTQLYHATFRAYDKNDKILGEYCVEKSTGGESLLNMNVRSEDASGNQIAHGLLFKMTNDGSVVKFTPTSNNKVHLGDVNAKWLKVHSDDVVHTSGNENISGTKTFIDTIVSNLNFYNTSDVLDVEIPYVAIKECTNGLYQPCIAWKDKDSYELGSLRIGRMYSQDTTAILSANTFTTDGKYVSAEVQVVANSNSDGKSYATAPTPSQSANSNEIVTAEWVIDKGLADDSNVVHKTGDETINGTKTFTNNVHCYSLKHPTDNSYFYLSGGSNWDKGANLFLYGASLTSGNAGVFEFVARNTTQTKTLKGYPNGALTWDGKSLAIDENLVHRSGDETIAGNKTFTETIRKKNSALDLQVNPSSHQYNSFLFTDKNNAVMGYLEHIQTTTGVNAMGLYAKDKNNVTHGFQVTSEDNVVPLGDGVVNLGLSGYKWKNVYATKFIGNLQGNADTATSATKASYLDNYSSPGANKIYLDWSKQVNGYVGLKVDGVTMGGLITTTNLITQTNTLCSTFASGIRFGGVGCIKLLAFEWDGYNTSAYSLQEGATYAGANLRHIVMSVSGFSTIPDGSNTIYDYSSRIYLGTRPTGTWSLLSSFNAFTRSYHPDTCIGLFVRIA